MRKVLLTLVTLLLGSTAMLHAQQANFNFTAAPVNAGSPWTNVSGDPSVAVRTATASGITISSVAVLNWAAYNGSCSFNGGGVTNGSFFPPAVMLNQWFQYSEFYGAYDPNKAQLEISGLNKDSAYTVKMTASFNNTSFNLNPTRYTVAGLVVYGNVNVNGNFNVSGGAVFNNVVPDASGKIRVFVNTYGGSNTAGISGLQIIRERTAGVTPTVAVTRPSNNSIFPAGSNVSIAATASETGGSIRKVEFYADTTRIGEDSTAPYEMTWNTPDPKSYAIKARAIDGFGSITIATVNITIQSLNGFWSTKGNTATGDTSFLGTVDSNRLAFRTKNIERLSISPTGMISVPGTKDPVKRPSLKIYENGDLAVGTTMDRSVNTDTVVGMRYYSKMGMLQIGASDRLDTTQSPLVYSNLPTSGIVINSDWPNSIKGKLMNTVMAATTTNLDSGWRTENAFIGVEQNHFIGGPDNSLIRSFIGGFDNTFAGPVIDGSSVTGAEMYIPHYVSYSNISGYAHETKNPVNVSLVSGVANQFGGLAQLVSGMDLINRTRGGATLGAGNVDFASLPYTGWGDTVVSNQYKYPLLALGNAYGENTVRTNALTVLYSGRTQINTTGYNHALTESAVTPQAALDVVSTNTGVLLPRLTTAQRNAIVSGDLHPGLLLYNSDSSAFQFYNGAGWNSVGSGSGQSSRWQYSSGTLFDNDDNVAIGTNDAKGYKLAVKGSALFTKVQVRSVANWPDYVFDKSYRLRSLEELEAYIGKYKHLPEMISAARADAEGLDIATNQAAFLKKVEELTLYLIDENKQLRSHTGQLTEQNGKLAAQDKQIAEQKKLVSELNKQMAEQNARFQDQQRQIDELKALLNKK